MTCPVCPYCDRPSRLVTGNVIYPRRPDLAHKSFYRCDRCEAYVGCHPGTVEPLGRLANAELRRAKQAAHRVFDPRWERGGPGRRRAAYEWLASQLGIPAGECHIGEFDLETCRRVVEICRK